MMETKLKFILADDHAIVRKGLKQIIIDEFQNSVVVEASDGLAVLQELAKSDYDLMVCDLSMPGISGMELCKRVREINPTLPVLILSMHAEETYAIRALRSGASGYLTKESAPEEMIIAIKNILNGKRYVSSSLAAMMADYIGDTSHGELHDRLSDREMEVLKLIAAGKSLSKIGVLFNLSPNTISTYRSRILEKMRMKSNAELVRYSVEHNIK